MGKVVNIEIDQNISESFIKYLLSNFSNFTPNFSKLLIFTPSKNASDLLRIAGLKYNIILPKIAYIGSIDEEFLIANKINIDALISIKTLPDIKLKLLIFNIAKKYLTNFSSTTIFQFIEDFIEIENLILTNETNLALTLKKSEHIIANMASKLQISLITFLKIYEEWLAFKKDNHIVSRFEKNILFLQELKKCDFSNYAAVFGVFFEGTSKIQISFLKSIFNLNHGFLILHGIEKNIEVLNNLISILKATSEDIIFLKSDSTISKNYHYKSFDNLYLQSLHICLHVKNIISQTKNVKIGIIASNPSTGFLISKIFLNHNIPITNIFTSSVAQSPYFILFEEFCKSFVLHKSDVFAYLSCIKNPLTNFDKEKVEAYENELRSQNLKTPRPFYCTTDKTFCDMKDFILKSYQQFQNILLKKDDNFDYFIKKIAEYVEEFTLEKPEDYLFILKQIANSEKSSSSESKNIFVLSKAESKGMKFDYIFLIDTEEGVFTNDANSNKILNSYIQEMLEIKMTSRIFDIYFFQCILHSAPNIFVFSVKTFFEESKQLKSASFIEHEFKNKNFLPLKMEFAEIATKPKPAIPNPEVKEELMPDYLTPSSIKNLLSNPFVFYVKNILKIKNLDQISLNLKPMHIGILIHKAIENYYAKQINIYFFIKRELLSKGFEYEFYCYEDCFFEVSKFFEKLPKPSCEKIIMEESIEVKFNDNITLKAKPDRVEIFENTANCIDYKVYSNVIKEKDLLTGEEPQLPTEEYMLSLLFPHLKNNINLFYYFIDLNQKEYSVLQKQMNSLPVIIVEKSLQILLTNLKTFMPRDFNETDEQKYLVRNYE